MDFYNALGNLNWWAVIVSVGLVIVLGALWYGNLFFGRAWIAAVGKTKIEIQQGRSMLWLVVATLFWTTLLVLTIALLEQFIGIVTWQDGVALGLFVGFGLAVASGIVHGLFENRQNSLLWITAGHTLLMCLLPAVIIAAWR